MGLCIVLLTGSAVASPMEEFAKLDQDMMTAAEAYLNAIRAAKRSTASPGFDDAKPEVVDGRLAVLRKMDAVSEAAAGSSEGAYIAVEAFLWAMTIDATEGLQRFRPLIKRFPNDAQLDKALAAVAGMNPASGEAVDWVAALEELIKSTGRNEARTMALMGLGRIHMAVQELSKAKAAFEAVVLESKDDALLEVARGSLYEIDHLQVGMVAPDFTTKRLDGTDVSLKSLRGKVVLLSFWASWCPTCVGEVGHLKAAATRFSDRPFEIVAVSVDDTRAAVVNTAGSFHMPGIQTWDERGDENPVAKRYNANNLPVWYLIDAEGVIRARDPFGEKLIPAIAACLVPSAETPR